MLGMRGSEWDPVILPVFKTGARHLRGVEGVFDSHTLPPESSSQSTPQSLRRAVPRDCSESLDNSVVTLATPLHPKHISLQR